MGLQGAEGWLDVLGQCPPWIFAAICISRVYRRGIEALLLMPFWRILWSLKYELTAACVAIVCCKLAIGDWYFEGQKFKFKVVVANLCNYDVFAFRNLMAFCKFDRDLDVHIYYPQLAATFEIFTRSCDVRLSLQQQHHHQNFLQERKDSNCLMACLGAVMEQIYTLEVRCIVVASSHTKPIIFRIFSSFQTITPADLTEIGVHNGVPARTLPSMASLSTRQLMQTTM